MLCCMVGFSLVFLLENVSWGAASPQSKYVVVLGYTLRNTEDTADLTTLHLGDKALVKVYLIDPRLPYGECNQVQAKLDTKSFISENKSDSINGDARVERNGMGYTLSFWVQYIGGSNCFSFKYTYKDALANLDMEQVEITVIQCQSETYPGENNGESETETINESLPESETLTESIEDTSLGNGSMGETGSTLEPMETISEKLIRASQFIVDDIYYGDSPVLAGTDFDCAITIAATQGDESIKNAIVSLSLPYGLSFVEDTDRVFLGTLEAGKRYKANFRLHADESIRNTICTLTVILSGVSSYYALPLDKKDTVQINLTPVENIAITSLELPEKINAAYDDGSGRFGFTLTNKGYAAVRDVEISIEGDAFESTSSFIVEELKASEDASVNLNLVTQEEGTLTGNIHITYINNFGETKELNETIKVEAEYRKAEINHDIVISPEIIQEPPLIPDWIWIIVTLGAVLGGIWLIHKIFKILKMSTDE